MLITDVLKNIYNFTQTQVLGDDTRHRLCIWHLEQNAVSHCALLRSDPKFKEKFDICMKYCYTEDQFEKEWRSMIEDFNLQENTWFPRLYDLRHKWSRVFNMDAFSAGILSSQRSESTNNAISFNASKHTSLTQFFGLFDACVERWRDTETNKDYKCSQGYPRSATPHPFLKQASKVQ